MSRCSNDPLTPRRRFAAIAASMAALSASTPLLIRHAAGADWTDALLGAFVGVALGTGIVLLIAAKKRARG